MFVKFKFAGTVTLTVPYDLLPPGLLGRDAEAVREWVQAWLKDQTPGLSLAPDRVYLPVLVGGDDCRRKLWNC